MLQTSAGVLNPQPPGLQSEGKSNWATEAGTHICTDQLQKSMEEQKDTQATKKPLHPYPTFFSLPITSTIYFSTLLQLLQHHLLNSSANTHLIWFHQVVKEIYIQEIICLE